MARGSRDIIKHRLEEFDDRLIDGYTQLYKEATIEYVKAAAKTIPRLTGQARASISAAARSLGLKVRVSTGSPTSSNFSQRQASMRAGNTIARGYGLGRATIKVDQNSARWNYTNTLTSAHNNYPYLDKHDKKWHTFAEGKAALSRYIEANENAMIDRILREVL
jgi:hypothetical protein